ncbi:MAG TPA: hypothetical protein VLJ61_19140 [Pyrinomonadaceae bacterium]|nr:hypothetical protein [Pyrinomonadaceae bacterium]
MNLVRDCLDKQLVDANGRKMGRVDGIVLTLARGRQPRVTHIETGAVTQATRLHPRLGRMVAALAHRLGRALNDPYRIPWAKVATKGDDITVNVRAEETPALVLERWVRAHLIGRIPGA